MKEPDWKQVGEDVANDWRGSGDDLGSVIARHLPAAYALGKSHGPDWLPIEDAPRDEAILVGFRFPNGFWRTQHAIYISKYSEESTEDFAEYCEEKDEYYTPEGWYEVCFEHDEYSAMRMPQEPIHCMPLPPPPEPKL